ncbi:hypothetical protein [Pelotalea chapellei]|uniref:Uncharacterized protein n=1 Tax=Pelotalea chapellei TaxID=44671 RepID=A0ABS5UCC2_9BACT|nr:hypothetical protein [Pelotalea chapellei]MBT1073337.1 hypothetical protein [Pelotalea chapellei]
MKKIIVYLAMGITCCGAGMVYAESASPNVSAAQKDECILISKNCQNQVLSIQEKMKRLQTEIKKGDRVYTPDELRRLDEKLQDVQKTLDVMLRQ